jgi:hypothetical protein
MPAGDRDEEEDDGCRFPSVWDAGPDAGDTSPPPRRDLRRTATGAATALLSRHCHVNRRGGIVTVTRSSGPHGDQAKLAE